MLLYSPSLLEKHLRDDSISSIILTGRLNIILKLNKNINLSTQHTNSALTTTHKLGLDKGRSDTTCVRELSGSLGFEIPCIKKKKPHAFKKKKKERKLKTAMHAGELSGSLGFEMQRRVVCLPHRFCAATFSRGGKRKEIT